MQCKNCNTYTPNPKYCSRSCAAQVNNRETPKRKTKKVCSKCSNFVKNYKTTLCEFHLTEYKQSRVDHWKEKTLSEYWEKDSLKSLHPSSRNAHIGLLARSHFKHLRKLPCRHCGYDKHVELCHIKPISSFGPDSRLKDVNCIENIVQLCPNCHWEFDRGLLSLSAIYQNL